MILGEFVCLRSKMYAFKSEDENKRKLKGISKSYSKNNNFEEYRKRLDGEEYEKYCENYIFRSINHEMYLQEVKKSTLLFFDDKPAYMNEIESEPWT